MAYIIPVVIILVSCYVCWRAGKIAGSAEERIQATVPAPLHETKDPRK